MFVQLENALIEHELEMATEDQHVEYMKTLEEDIQLEHMLVRTEPDFFEV